MSWERLARRQHGVITRAQLRECGIDDRAVTRLRSANRIERRGHGVYVVASAPVTFDVLLWTAVLHTGGTLAFATAAYLWDLIDEPADRIDVIVEVDPGRRPPFGVRLHRTQLLDSDRLIHRGLPVTSRACSSLDYLSRLSIGPAIRFADRALQQRWMTIADIEHRLMTQKGRTGNNRLREILNLTSDRAAAKSERQLHALLQQSGIGGWTANRPIQLPSGSAYEIDVAWDDWKIGIEIDGMAHHINADRFQSDRTRQNQLVNQGWLILRFTWWDLVDRPQYVLATIRTAIAARSGR